jgi:hypothetical protein
MPLDNDPSLRHKSTFFSKTTVVFSPNSAFVACRWDYRVWIFDVHTRTLVKSINMVHNADASAVSSDGSRFLCLWTNCFTLWDLLNEK